jgi:hypothetical protein
LCWGDFAKNSFSNILFPLQSDKHNTRFT